LRKLLKEKISEIRIFSRDEKKQDDLRNSISDNRIKYYIGDVRNFDSLNEALQAVDMVFHAAALKQVPSCEYFPYEAVQTNIIGAKNLIKASLINKIKKVIFLSTDKAVYPINAMGMTKALMEKLVLSSARKINQNTIFCITRYGNVMLSRGSVIPLFIRQIKNKKNITITDPEMTRFLMSLDNSVDLVLHALKYGTQGDLFVQKSPASTILNLAETLKKIYKSNVKIKIIGTRLGEKKHETLISKEEMVRAKDSKNYFKIPIDKINLNYKNYFTAGNIKISDHADYTSENTKRLNELDTIKLLQKIDLDNVYD
jgi:FlaA1/EpsC-like NDP-sugar epimerase